MNFGVISLAAPKAASSRVARYSQTARLARTKIVSAPLVTRNGALFIGIGSDEARVHRKALAQAAFHHGLEEVPQNVALPEPTMSVAREGGMVRNLAVQSQTAGYL